jgi:NADPH-dependent 2,4-dienoyl-CoA reductase/sulfur reductase-like enzyme
MDLSTGGDLRKIRRRILDRSPVPLGTVPIYQAAIQAIDRRGSIVNMTEDDLFAAIEAQAQEGVDFMTVHCGLTQKAIDRLKKQGRVADIVSRGGAFHLAWMLYHDKENPLYSGYDRLLVASGARPVLPRVKDLAGPGIHTLWTLADADRLEPELRPGRRVTLIGSGFVSLQAAWAARVRGLEVAVLEALPRILPKVLDEKASALLEKKMREHGVDVRCAAGIERVERRRPGSADGASLRIVLACGEPSIEADVIVIGAGVRPCLEFLRGTAVKTAEGILVDERMRTSVANIYAAGDAAQGLSAFGEPHVIHALWPTAVEQGKVAGANMAGRDRIYEGSLNMNVTEMFGLTVASMGRFLPSGEPGESMIEEHDPRTGRYVKLLFRDGVPLGGVVLGASEDLAVLAALRPRIRTHRSMHPVPRRPFAELHHRLVRPHPTLTPRS